MFAHLSVCALAASLLCLAPAPVQAQDCGPLTFEFTNTGPGCVPFSGAVAPGLDFSLFAANQVSICQLTAFFRQGVFEFPLPIASLLVGASDPSLPFPGLPNCVLRVLPLFALPMTPEVIFQQQTLFLNIPQDPIFIGAEFHAQGVWPVGGELRVSNGVRVRIS